MVGWHHQLNGHESEQAQGVGDTHEHQCCSPWGSKESDMTEQLKNNTPFYLLLVSEIHQSKFQPKWCSLYKLIPEISDERKYL